MGDLQARIRRYQRERDEERAAKESAVARIRELELALRKAQSDAQATGAKVADLTHYQEGANDTIRGLSDALGKTEARYSLLFREERKLRYWAIHLYLACRGEKPLDRPMECLERFINPEEAPGVDIFEAAVSLLEHANPNGPNARDYCGTYIVPRVSIRALNEALGEDAVQRPGILPESVVAEEEEGEGK